MQPESILKAADTDAVDLVFFKFHCKLFSGSEVSLGHAGSNALIPLAPLLQRMQDGRPMETPSAAVELDYGNVSVFDLVAHPFAGIL